MSAVETARTETRRWLASVKTPSDRSCSETLTEVVLRHDDGLLLLRPLRQAVCQQCLEARHTEIDPTGAPAADCGQGGEARRKSHGSEGEEEHGGGALSESYGAAGRRGGGAEACIHINCLQGVQRGRASRRGGG